MRKKKEQMGRPAPQTPCQEIAPRPHQSITTLPDLPALSKTKLVAKKRLAPKYGASPNDFKSLPAIMRKRFVRLRHTVRIFSFLDRGATLIGRIVQFPS